MRPYLRYLRICWTVLCITAAITLCVLWVRSYTWAYIVGMNSSHGFATSKGVLILNKPIGLMAKPSTGTRSPNRGHNGRFGIFYCPLDVFSLVLGSGGIAIPIWAAVAILSTLALVPWTPTQFSLMSLLIAMTLIAALLGLTVWSLR